MRLVEFADHSNTIGLKMMRSMIQNGAIVELIPVFLTNLKINVRNSYINTSGEDIHVD